MSEEKNENNSIEIVLTHVDNHGVEHRYATVYTGLGDIKPGPLKQLRIEQMTNAVKECIEKVLDDERRAAEGK